MHQSSRSPDERSEIRATLAYGIQAADSPGLDEAALIARIIVEEANHENPAAYFLECSLLHAARTGRRPPSAAARHRLSCTESHHFRLGWASNRRSDSRNYAELLCACSNRRRLCRPSRRLSDLHDDEFRLHRH